MDTFAYVFFKWKDKLLNGYLFGRDETRWKVQGKRLDFSDYIWFCSFDFGMMSILHNYEKLNQKFKKQNATNEGSIELMA